MKALARIDAAGGNKDFTTSQTGRHPVCPVGPSPPPAPLTC